MNSEHHSLELLESCFLGEISITHFKANTDFNISSERSFFTDSSADVSTVYLTQLDDRETVSLVSVNEDATFLVHVEKRVDLLPGRLTKVLLRTEHLLDTDLLLNNHFKNPYVNFDTCFCRPEGGLMILYATPTTAQSITLFPGDSFCSACSAANSVSVS